MIVQMVIFSQLFSGSNKKRALVDGANSMLEIQKFNRDCVGSNVRHCSWSFSWLHGNKRSRTSLLEEVTPIIKTGTNNAEGDSNEELQKISNQIAAKSRKRSRPFSWLRHIKQMHLNFEETSIKTSSATILTEKDSVSGRLQDDVNSCLNSCEKVIPYKGSFCQVQFWFDMLEGFHSAS